MGLDISSFLNAKNFLNICRNSKYASSIEVEKNFIQMGTWFLLWEGVVVLKVLIFNSVYFGRVWWS